MSNTQELIKEVGKEIVSLLLQKNKAYGDTANNPPQIFSKLSAKEGLLARLDDKLSRIKKLSINHIGSDPMKDESGIDTIKDITGYLILLLVQIRKEENVIIKKLIKSKNEKLKEFK
tara:strand:- start:1277 stop:1627 length:351 start_codon:yes stop_codon:yes gene_type:complete